MNLKTFFDPKSFTFTYIISCQKTKNCAILDSVMDFDEETGQFSSKSADRIINHIVKNDLSLEWILESHIHADHVTAANYIKDKLDGKIAISEEIKQICEYWSKIFNVKNEALLI